MKLELKKFGTTLISRQMGREAYLALQAILQNEKPSKSMIVDFDGVSTLAPSWADEFLTPIFKHYGENLVLKNLDNPSVQMTLEILEASLGKKFKRG